MMSGACHDTMVWSSTSCREYAITHYGYGAEAEGSSEPSFGDFTSKLLQKMMQVASINRSQEVACWCTFTFLCNEKFS